MRVGKVLAAMLVLALSAAQAQAAGFRLPEAGAKAMGMAMAFTAQADDPSAIYYNPAGLIQLEGMNVMAGVTYIRENGSEFTGSAPLTLGATASETQKDLNFFLPNVYWTRKASPDFAYGIGLFVPFGLAQEYKNKDTNIFREQVDKVEIQTIVLNPTVAWKVNEILSVGAGIDFMWGKAILDQTVPALALPPTFPSAGYVHLEGSGTAWGYNFGALLNPVKPVKVGLSVRSPFTLKINDANVDVTDGPAVPGTVSQHTSASARINMPATAALGISYTAGRLTVEADADVTFWSRFRNLTIKFKEPLLGAIPEANRPERWKDVVAYRLGGEYRVSDPLALRLGIAFDPTPVPANTMSPLLPDSNRIFYAAGVGYKVGKAAVDVSYMYLQKLDRTVNNLTDGDPIANNFNGTWKGSAHLVALDLSYKF